MRNLLLAENVDNYRVGSILAAVLRFANLWLFDSRNAKQKIELGLNQETSRIMTIQVKLGSPLEFCYSATTKNKW